jgi:hypothetical protein
MMPSLCNQISELLPTNIFSHVVEDLLPGNEYMFQVKNSKMADLHLTPFSHPRHGYFQQCYGRFATWQ